MAAISALNNIACFGVMLSSTHNDHETIHHHLFLPGAVSWPVFLWQLTERADIHFLASRLPVLEKRMLTHFAAKRLAS